MRAPASHRFVLIDVFTEQRFAGNQLVVFPDADALDAEEMQALAREFNFSEAAFVCGTERESGLRRIRIFTPRQEVAFAGHPLIGASIVLASESGIPGSQAMRLLTGAGPVSIVVSTELTEAKATLTFDVHPTSAPPDVSPESVASVLSLRRESVRRVHYGSIGLPFCFVKLHTTADVDRATLDRTAWNQSMRAAWSMNMFLYAVTAHAPRRAYARMFAPALGIEEDPATGSACLALAWLLATEGEGSGSATLRIEQGRQMGRSSHLEASADMQAAGSVRVTLAGNAVLVGEGTVWAR